MRNIWGRNRKGDEPPIELRFVDLFMILLTTLIFISVILSVISAGIPRSSLQEAPRIATRALPPALEGQPYELTLAMTGGSGPPTWELAGGSLPPGLRLLSDGAIAGTPARRGRTACRLRVRTGGLADERELAVVVHPPPGRSQPMPLRILAPDVLLPRAVPEQPYRTELRIAGGTPPYRWHLMNGKLPPGVSWSPRGLVVGTPEDVAARGEDFSFAMRALDGTGRKVVQRYTLEVRAPEKPWWRPRLGWVYFMIFFVAYHVIIYLLLLWYGSPASEATEGLRDRLRRKRGAY